MNVYFTETEPQSEDFFEANLDKVDLGFLHSLAELPSDADCASIFIASRITAEVLDAHPRLRFVATRSSGVDHIDLAACKQRGITVSYVPNYGENTVAEHTFALLLALSRKIRPAITMKRGGAFSFESFRGFDLKDKTIGVVGAGRIGLHVIRIAKAFGMNVIAHDINRAGLIAEVLGFEYVSFDDLLGQSDIISLHAPLTADTFHLLNGETLKKCRPGVIIVNTARGALIDTAALIEALDSGIVGGAGLDVLEDERLFRTDASKLVADQIIADLQQVSSPEERHMRNPQRLADIQRLKANESLLSRPNVVFTPHIAFNSAEAVRRIDEVTVQNILAFVAGKPINVVPSSEPA
ncbi:MAG TPA: NAD(P)-dependent oxidoreductase [Chthoniobacterales bacterium]|nr:NAD(P)-dependent oxidoreductase [Chthoniobacterales bacterium]